MNDGWVTEQWPKLINSPKAQKCFFASNLAAFVTIFLLSQLLSKHMLNIFKVNNLCMCVIHVKISCVNKIRKIYFILNTRTCSMWTVPWHSVLLVFFIIRQEKKREKTKNWKQAKLKKAQLLKSKENTSEIVHLTKPVIGNEEFTNDQLPQSCYLFVSWENQNDHPASFQLNQNLPKRRQESKLDMDGSNGPLVKKPRLENPSEDLPQAVSAHGTPTPEIEDGTSAGPTCSPGLLQSRMEDDKPNLTATKGTCSAQRATTKNEAVIPKPRSKKSMRKVNKAASQSKEGTTRWINHEFHILLPLLWDFIFYILFSFQHLKKSRFIKLDPQACFWLLILDEDLLSLTFKLWSP